MPTLSAAELTDFTTRIFEAAGLPAEDARIVAASLVGANLRGHDSHGVMRAVQYLGFIQGGQYQIGVALKIEQETEALVVADGQWGFGQIQALRLLERIMPKAHALGVAVGAARECGHIGRLGEYAEIAVAEGLILMATVNNCGSGQRVAPPGGREPRLGTNPLCVGVPTPEDPVVLDFGTSVVAEGKVRVYHINNKPTPEGWLLDSTGIPTTDPSVLYNAPQGSILPMGGSQAYKGFGLSLVLDMMAAGLTGGCSPFAGAPAAKGNNVLFVAFDPARFAGSDHLLGQSGRLTEYVRNTPRTEGVERILLPGDPERVILAERSTRGIPLDPNHWQRLVEAAQSLDVAVPELADRSEG